MKLVWSERPADPRMGLPPGKAGDLMEALGGGCWCMGARYDYFIEAMPAPPAVVASLLRGRMLYVLHQQWPDGPDGSGEHGAVTRHSMGFDVLELKGLAQRWDAEW